MARSGSGRRFHDVVGVLLLFAIIVWARPGSASPSVSDLRGVNPAATGNGAKARTEARGARESADQPANALRPNRRQLTYTAVHTSYEPDGTSSATITETVTETVSEVIRWDIIHLTPGPAINPGGIASAKATDAPGNETSTITVTGSGTFAVPEGDEGRRERDEGRSERHEGRRERDEERRHVTGGGMWTTTTGAITVTGTYKVTEVVRWTEAPGTLAVIDNIGNLADLRAGLAVLRIVYSDGSLGTLTVSCSLGGTPNTVFEGITATKDFTDYWKRQAPSGSPAGANANRTAFHVVHKDD